MSFRLLLRNSYCFKRPGLGRFGILGGFPFELLYLQLSVLKLVEGRSFCPGISSRLAAKYYGSRDAMIDAGKKRTELREVVASKLAREVMPK